MQDVEEFAKDKDLVDIIPLLTKGALVAQNPRGFEQLSDLDEADRQCLREEITHRWKHPRILYFTIILNSIAAAIQGWDQEGSNGANLSWPVQFGVDNSATLPDGSPNPHANRNQWIVGFVNSTPYMTIAVL